MEIIIRNFRDVVKRKIRSIHENVLHFQKEKPILLLFKCLHVILILNVNIYIQMVITQKYYLATANKILLSLKV